MNLLGPDHAEQRAAAATPPPPRRTPLSVTKTAAPTAPWFEHLVDSVRALGEAAREWQLAHQAAEVLEAGVELERRHLHDGKIDVRGPENRGWDAKPRRRGQHEHAVFDLQKIYREHRWLTRSGYEHAARLYASGAAWAIARVQAGKTPARVRFWLDEDRQPIPGDYKVTGLGRYRDAEMIAAAYEEVLSMDLAGQAAEDLAGRDYVADHEATAMFEASRQAQGLPDAAYRYGRLAEDALHFVLLGPKQEHREQLHATRQEGAAQDEPEADPLGGTW